MCQWHHVRIHFNPSVVISFIPLRIYLQNTIHPKMLLWTNIPVNWFVSYDVNSCIVFRNDTQSHLTVSVRPWTPYNTISWNSTISTSIHKGMILLIIKSNKISQPRGIGLESPDRYEIWQTFRGHQSLFKMILYIFHLVLLIRFIS